MRIPRQAGVLVFLAGLAGALAAAPLACANGDEVGPGFSQQSGGGDGAGGSGSASSSKSSASHASSATTSASTSGSASATASASASTGAGGSCDDYTEPDETESQAYDLGALSDDDSNGSSIPGVLGTQSDVDWYEFDGSDTFGYVVDATADVTTMAAFKLCIYIQCHSGNPNFTCPGGTNATTSPDGRQGCCGNGGFTVDNLCSGSDDSAFVYISVANEDQDACLDYTLAYHF